MGEHTILYGICRSTLSIVLKCFVLTACRNVLRLNTKPVYWPEVIWSKVAGIYRATDVVVFTRWKHIIMSAASDHSDNMATNHSHGQPCSPMSQPMNFNTASHNQPTHASGYSQVLPQQSHMVVPRQQYSASDQNMHYRQVQGTLADHASRVDPALTGEHGQLTSSMQPNAPTYSEVKFHPRHSSSHDYGNMSGLVVTMPGQVHHSPKAVHQNMEGMVVSGHVQGRDGHMAHGGYYPVAYQGQQQQHMSNSGQISWQSPPRQQFMQGAVLRQGFAPGVPSTFNSQPFRGQNQQYAVNQHGDVYYQQQHQPIYSELNSGHPRGMFVQQQHCIGPNGQRLMFTRPAMHIPLQHHQPRMSMDAQFVYYAPHTGSSAPAQQMSPQLWSGEASVMKPGVSVQYCNQQDWQQRPMVVAYGGPLPGQRMPSYHHLSPEPRMGAEFCDNFAGTLQQHLSPSHHSLLAAGSVHCYRPSSNLRMGNASMMCVPDERYVETCHMQVDGTPVSAAPVSQDYVPAAVTIGNVGTAVTISSTSGTVVLTSDSSVLTTTSHPLEHLANCGTSQSHQSSPIVTAASSLSSYNHPGYYVHETNMIGSQSTGEYCSYNAASQYVSHNQHSGQQHVNSYNFCTSPPRGVPYSGSPHYPPQFTRCAHPYQPHHGAVHWQAQVVEHPLHNCRNVLPDRVASHHHLEQESLTTTASSTTCSESSSVTCSAPSVSSPASVISENVNKHFDNTDNVGIARTNIAVQSAVTDTGNHVPSLGSPNSVKDHSTHCLLAAVSSNCSPISLNVMTATGSGVIMHTTSAVDSTSVMAANDAANDKVPALLVQDKPMTDAISGPPGTESQNCLQVPSSASCKSSKGSKRSGSRKGTTKTKKRRPSLPLDSSDKFCAVTCTDGAESSSDSICTASAVKTAPTAESVDRICSVTSTCMDQTAVVVPYGWRRHVDSSNVVYYRLLFSLLC